MGLISFGLAMYYAVTMNQQYTLWAISKSPEYLVQLKQTLQAAERLGNILWITLPGIIAGTLGLACYEVTEGGSES